MMTLQFLGSASHFAFFFGSELCRMSDENMFFPTKDLAEDAARRHGLQVNRDRSVTTRDDED